MMNPTSIRALFSLPGFVAASRLVGFCGDRYARILVLRRRNILRAARSVGTVAAISRPAGPRPTVSRLYVERLDWLAKTPRFTQRVAMHGGALCRERTNKAGIETERIHDSTVKGLDTLDLQPPVARAGLPAPRAIGEDEIAIRKGHNYRIVVSARDRDRGRPIWVGGTGRTEADGDRFFAALDRWKPFHHSLLRNAPQARVIFDTFPLMRHLGDALDEVRRREDRHRATTDRACITGPRSTLRSHREHRFLDGRRSLDKRRKANR